MYADFRSEDPHVAEQEGHGDVDDRHDKEHDRERQVEDMPVGKQPLEGEEETTLLLERQPRAEESEGTPTHRP